jgi:C-methyltransferase-like protein/putative zinc binding protein/methyltransferase family protein
MICRGENLTPFLDLGEQPNGNAFPSEQGKLDEATYPLLMCVCTDCWLVQLEDYPPPEVLFPDHPYVTGVNEPVVRHFERLSEHIIQKFDLPSQSLVIDIGANDGSLLGAFRARGMRVLGVDPGQRTGNLAQQSGITVCETFWNSKTGQAIAALNLRPRVITATAVFYHVPDLHDFVGGLTQVMDEETVFVTQCVYMKDVLERLQFDHFYHEHTCVHSVSPLKMLFQRHGLRILDVEMNDIHGGSFVMYVVRDSHRLPTDRRVEEAIAAEREQGLFEMETYERFTDSVEQNRRDLVEVLEGVKKSGLTVQALGAPVKGSTILNYCDIGPDLVESAVEVNEFKIGRVTPGTHIPIIDERESGEPPHYYLVLAWNFLDHFVEKYRDYLEAGGKFIVPNPAVRIVDQASITPK